MKKNNKQTLKWVYENIKKYLPQLFLISFLAAAVSLVFVLLALVSKNILEIATADRQGSIILNGALLLSLVVVQVLCSGLESILKSRVSAKLTVTLREGIFKQAQGKRFSQISKYHSGDLLNRMTSDVDVLQSGVVNILPNLVSMVTKIIGCMAALVYLEPTVALTVLAIGLIIPLFARFLSKRFKQLHKQAHKTEGETRSFIQECFENRAVMKSFKTQDFIFSKLSNYLKQNYKIKMKRAVLSVVLHLGLYSFFTIGYYVVLLWGALQIANPKIAFTYGTLMAFLQLISQLRLPLQNISGILPQYYSLLASAERLIEIEQLESEKAALCGDKLEKLCQDFKFLQADGVSFSYGDETVIKDLSFKINRGSMTAILGDSGSGKSTVFKLLLSLYEINGGRITLNGNTDITSENRGIFSYVPQGNMIISGSIKENISMGNPNISDLEIENAAKIAEIYDLVQDLPNGFDSVLLEHGSGLSEGQLQRIAIARAIANASPVLLLDEATSALDMPTEKKVLNNIKALTDKTVILVTHRLENVNLCDGVVNLGNI